MLGTFLTDWGFDLQIELDVNQKKFQAYTHRYIYPWVESGSTSPHYYSFDIAGENACFTCSEWLCCQNDYATTYPNKWGHKQYYAFDTLLTHAGAHVIHLASYEDFDSNSQQYKWLQSDLDAFSRERTPWLLVNWHAPWYHTYIAVSTESILFSWWSTLSAPVLMVFCSVGSDCISSVSHYKCKHCFSP